MVLCKVLIGFKVKEVTLVDPFTIIKVDDEGYITITEEMLKVKERLPVVQFERRIVDMIDYDQITRLLQYWSASLTIIIARTANVLKVDKSLAKRIIGIAEEYGLLVSGWNSTYRIVDSVVKERWKEAAIQRVKVDKPQETTHDIIARLGMGGESGEEHVDGKEIDDTVKLSKDTSNAKSNIARVVDKVKGKSSSIKKLVPDDAPLEEQSEEQLQKRLSYLQERLATHTEWTELETPWMVNDEIHRIKAQLRHFDNTRVGQTYINETNTLKLPKSITEVVLNEENEPSHSTAQKVRRTPTHTLRRKKPSTH